MSELHNEQKVSKILENYQKIANTLNELEKTVEEISEFSSSYDLDVNSPGNGYKSFVVIVEKAAEKITKIVKNVKENHRKIFFRRKFYEK